MRIYVFFYLFALLLWQPKNQTLVAQAAPVPNVVSIQSEFKYMAVREVSNLDYAEYLDYLERNSGTAEYQRALPDTSAWRINGTLLEPLVTTYHRHAAYYDYPAVNLTHGQALGYCAWLTKILNENLAEHEGKVAEVLVRLPTEAEWEKAAYGNQPIGQRAWYPWGHNGLRVTKKGKTQGRLLANYRRPNGNYLGIAGRAFDAVITEPTSSGIQTGNGFHHLSGNVAEMLKTPGKSKGGGWQSSGAELRIDAVGLYDEANPNLGFRYLVEVVRFNDPIQPGTLTAKNIEERMQAVGENGFYADAYEVSNRDFARFLHDHPEYAANAANWASTDYDFHSQYGEREAYADHPVMNVSYAAAKAYCAWLTKAYNSLPNRKFNRVEFFLPSGEEYELAARGGKKHAPYPWGGPYVRNAKGCYLANFSPRSDAYQRSRPAQDESGSLEYYYDYPNDDYRLTRGDDGEGFVSKVKAYYPNDYGLYQIAGNAGEMLNEEGVSAGGGWLDPAFYLQTGTRNTYNGPRVDLGFRVYMREK